MNNKYRYLLLVAILTISQFALAQTAKTKTNPPAAAQKVEPKKAEPSKTQKKGFPAFKFYTLEGKTFTEKNMKKPKNEVLFIHYNPGCGHCQAQARDIMAEADKFAKHTIYWVTAGDTSQISKFYSMHLKSAPNCIMLQDRDRTGNTFFDILAAPRIMIFDKKGTKITALMQCKAPDIYAHFGAKPQADSHAKK